MNSTDELQKYYRLLSEQILHQKSIIDTLIHSNQRYTRGILYEELLRSNLRKLLPSNIAVAQGFIDFGGTKSPQCDIILYDSANYAPLLEVNDLVLIPYESANAIIEVKAKLGKAEMEKTMNNFEAIFKHIKIQSIRKFVFAFNSIKFTSLVELEILNPYPKFLDGIFVLKKGVINNVNDKIKIYNGEDAFITFIMTIFQYFYFNTGLMGMKPNPYNKYLDNITAEDK